MAAMTTKERDALWSEKLASHRKAGGTFFPQDDQQQGDEQEIVEPSIMSTNPVSFRCRGVLRELKRLHPSCTRACSEELEAAAAAHGVKLEHIGTTIGTILHGIDLSKELPDDTISFIRQCLLERKAIFFREQELSREQHLALGRRFGTLEIHPFSKPVEGYPEILQIVHGPNSIGTENSWHSDVTWRQEPSLGSILLCRECAGLGGDTVFSDSHAQFDGLPNALRNNVIGRTATNDYKFFRDSQRLLGVPEEIVQELKKDFPRVQHPVIRTHPETGKQGLYVNAVFTKHIDGMSDEDSAQILQILYNQAGHAEYQCRFRWAEGSIAFWDNRACQHYAVSDYFPSSRVMDRVTVCGDTPFYKADQASRL